MKKSAVVVLYNPEIDQVKKNIATYLSFVDKLFIIDNSDQSNEDSFSGISGKIQYLANLKNEGIAKVLNYAAKKSLAEGFDLLLTMDQDSFFEESMISRYFDNVEKIDWERLAMVGITPKSYADRDKLAQDSEPIYSEKPLIITSGSLLNLKLFEVLGGFNEKLFIDAVDYDYCLKSIVKGYRIGQFENIYLYHVGGEPKIVFGRKVALYSPERYYFIFRNHLYLWIKYFGHFPKLMAKNALVTVILSAVPNLIYSKKRISFLASIGRAIRDVFSILKCK